MNPGRNKPAVWALVGLGVAAVVALVALVMQPWNGSDHDSGGSGSGSGGGGGEAAGQTFELDRGITIELRVPEGWRARATSMKDEKWVVLLPAGDDRDDAALKQAVLDLRGGRTAADVHHIAIFADSVSSDTDDWQLGPLETTSASGGHRVDRNMWKPVWRQYGIEVEAFDMGASKADPRAVDLLERMSTDDTIVASHTS